eukprot:gnl/Hemi2/13888_TR4719_c0_g11_i1.p1 gnl/Hemi2/13888_TR4719_c0_g11~~gnl/Hemi2/13888_TR4719_c0_g11_i1.p1  ORF type:complete len:214 (-),score=52.40 gnl/Hemi2/13888_TR4719_c0_g11_i1:351-992(-)
MASDVGKAPAASNGNGHAHPAASPTRSEAGDAAEADNGVIPLQNDWSFWHDKYVPNLSREQYQETLQLLFTFNTVQAFWKCFNNLPDVVGLRAKSSFHLMKAGIKPIWEDPANENGGKWSMRILKGDTGYAWKELVLAVIGEQFASVTTSNDDICGVTISIRQHDNIIELWNRNASATGSLNALLARVRALIPEAEVRQPFYKAHKEHTNFSK